jgi:hypothetical protein
MFSAGRLTRSLAGCMKTNPTLYRTIKVELAGDHGKTFPKIRLQGHWLKRTGFNAPGRVVIRPVGQGVVLLRYQPIVVNYTQSH